MYSDPELCVPSDVSENLNGWVAFVLSSWLNSYVQPGNKIIKGATLLVIEAMKMETSINAEKSGTIKSINVESGDNVETKDLLVEIN